MVTQVYGTADRFEIIFKQEKGRWVASVPTDFSDGQYACHFTAITDVGEIGYWTGMLYIPDCKTACARLEEDLYTIWLLPEE